MSGRAEGAQDYPGALDTLLEISSHRGRGPRSQPSDTRLREIICERLTDDSNVDASDIDVQVQAAEVTLSGTVTDRMQKRATEDLVADVAGVAEVHNLIAVRTDEIENRMSGL